MFKMGFTVYEEPLLRRYQAPFFSFACLFLLLINIATVVVPFYIAYGSHNFWIKRNTLYLQPEVQFTYKVLVVLHGRNLTENGEIQTWAWSTVPEIRTAYEPYLRAPVIQAWSEDYNLDDVADLWHLQIQMPLGAGERVYHAQALAFFDYKLRGRVSLEMDTLAYIEHSSALSGSDLSIQGEARLHQQKPLSVRSENRNPSLVGPIITNPENIYPNLIPNVISSYTKRNYTMNFENQYKVWNIQKYFDSYAEVPSTFCVNITMRMPVNEITYTPDVAEVLKIGWMQYITIGIVFVYGFSLLKGFVYTNQVLETRITEDAEARHYRPGQKLHQF